jgi:hypothetical protein
MAHKTWKKQASGKIRVLQQRAAFLGKLLQSMKTQEAQRDATVRTSVEEKAKLTTAALSDKLHDAHIKMSAVQAQCDAQQEQYTLARQELLEAQARNSSLQQRVLALEAESTTALNTSIEQTVEYGAEHSALRTENIELKKQKDHYKKRAKQARREHLSVKRQLQLAHAATEELKQTVHSELAVLRQQLLDL